MILMNKTKEVKISRLMGEHQKKMNKLNLMMKQQMKNKRSKKELKMSRLMR